MDLEENILRDLVQLLDTQALFEETRVATKLHEIYDETNDEKSIFFQIERGGSLDLNQETLQVHSFELFKHGDSSKFIYPHYFPFVFHCHPQSLVAGLSYQPPSGVDMAHSLLWGGLENFDPSKADDTITYLELVLSKEGIWATVKSPALYRLLLSLIKHDTSHRLETLYYLIEWYSFVVNTMLQNRLISVERYCELHKRIDVSYLLELLEREQNKTFRDYLTREFHCSTTKSKDLCSLWLDEVRALIKREATLVSELAQLECFIIRLLPWPEKEKNQDEEDPGDDQGRKRVTSYGDDKGEPMERESQTSNSSVTGGMTKQSL